MLPGHMMLGQMLDEQMSLDHFSTVKDGCANLGVGAWVKVETNAYSANWIEVGLSRAELGNTVQL